MKITIDQLKDVGGLHEVINLNYASMELNEVLLKKVNSAEVEVSAYLVGTEEIHLKLDVEYNVQYLDSVDLKELNLTFNFEEQVIFSKNQQSAVEFDYEDYIKEIDVIDLVWNLIIVDVPLNYTEHKFDVLEVLEEPTNTPFADLFKK